MGIFIPRKKASISREKGKDEKVNHSVCGVMWKYNGYDFYFLLFAYHLFLTFFTNNIYYI